MPPYKWDFIYLYSLPVIIGLILNLISYDTQTIQVATIKLVGITAPAVCLPCSSRSNQTESGRYQ